MYLLHYLFRVPNVLAQILDQEEVIALSEFQKLEQRISREHPEQAKKDSS